MRPNFDTAEFRCYSDPSNYQGNSIRMPPRGVVMQKESGFESKGLVLLLICGIYAVFLFFVARLFGYIVSKLTAPVISIVWRVETSEISVKPALTKLTDHNNNPAAALKMKVSRQQPRTISHG